MKTLLETFRSKLADNKKIIVDGLIVISVGAVGIFAGDLPFGWRCALWVPIVAWGLWNRSIRRLLPGHFSCGVCRRDKTAKYRTDVFYNGHHVCSDCVRDDPDLSRLRDLKKSWENPQIKSMIGKINDTLETLEYLRKGIKGKDKPVVLITDDPESFRQQTLTEKNYQK